MMRKLGPSFFLCLLVACGGAKKPAPEAPATTDLHADVVAFCSPETAEHAAGGLPDLGPFLEPKLHDTAVKKILLGMKDGTTSVADAKGQVDALITAENVPACPTRDKLFAPAP